MKTIAVLLCGSGHLDGSEIQESVGVLWALSAHPVRVQCIAPSWDHDTVHALNSSIHEKRNILVESARIARGNILALEQVQAKDYDALVIPGGFGVAKNLCDFALQGTAGAVHPSVQKLLQEFLGKPIGALCIAPMLLALAFPHQQFELTLGSVGSLSVALEELGHRHVVCGADQCHVDVKNRIVSSPAYLSDAPLRQIFSGIDQLAKLLLSCW